MPYRVSAKPRSASDVSDSSSYHDLGCGSSSSTVERAPLPIVKRVLFSLGGIDLTTARSGPPYPTAHTMHCDEAKTFKNSFVEPLKMPKHCFGCKGKSPSCHMQCYAPHMPCHASHPTEGHVVLCEICAEFPQIFQATPMLKWWPPISVDAEIHAACADVDAAELGAICKTDGLTFLNTFRTLFKVAGVSDDSSRLDASLSCLKYLKKTVAGL